MSPGTITEQADIVPHVSVVLPCYNEEAHVLLEIQRICAALDATDYPYEVLAVDDASTDGTLEV
ncbi:glycosyltransferase, partial [Catenulispora sp. NF23]|nr:glycosyltransferase [Catenulispora pinistramenti]